MYLSEDISIVRAKLKRLVVNGRVPLGVAQRVISNSAWWYGHPKGPVRAPKHYERISNGIHGLELEFGANYFLVETAIRRVFNIINDLVNTVESTGKKGSNSFLRLHMIATIEGAVANFNGDEYDGFYDSIDGFMIFGTQAISVNDFVNTICDFTEVYRITNK